MIGSTHFGSDLRGRNRRNLVHLCRIRAGPADRPIVDDRSSSASVSLVDGLLVPFFVRRQHGRRVRRSRAPKSVFSFARYSRSARGSRSAVERLHGW